MAPVTRTRHLVAAIRPLAGSALLRAAGRRTMRVRKEQTMTMRSIAALLSVLAFEACTRERLDLTLADASDGQTMASAAIPFQTAQR